MAERLAFEAEHPDRVPYLRYAFHNLYNYTALGGLASAALLTQNPWLAIAGAGAEALWLTFGPDSRLLRKLWFDRTHAGVVAEQERRRRALRVARLDDSLTGRVKSLELIQSQIHRLAQENPALTAELLQGELQKLDRLAESFIDLAVLTQRYREYLETQDPSALAADCRRYQDAASKATDPEQRKVAQKNLAVVLKRRDKLGEIQQFIEKAGGQMELIENTFGLLADQIISMRSPAELSGQLDELMDGVEAVKSTARETDAILEAAQ